MPQEMMYQDLLIRFNAMSQKMYQIEEVQARAMPKKKKGKKRYRKEKKVVEGLGSSDNNQTPSKKSTKSITVYRDLEKSKELKLFRDFQRYRERRASKRSDSPNIYNSQLNNPPSL